MRIGNARPAIPALCAGAALLPAPNAAFTTTANVQGVGSTEGR